MLVYSLLRYSTRQLLVSLPKSSHLLPTTVFNYNPVHDLVSPQENSKLLKEMLDTLHQSRSLPLKECCNYIECILEQLKFLKKPMSDRFYIRLLEVCMCYRLSDYAVKVFHYILDYNIPYSSSLFTALVSIIADEGIFSDALVVLDKAVSMGFQPSIHNFTPLLRTAGSAAKAKQILQRMEVCGVDSNVITFSTAIKSLEATADWRSALELLDWMRCKGIAPNEITYCCVITLTSKNGAGGHVAYQTFPIP